MRFLLTLLFFAAPTYAEIWERPPYIPDENHLPPESTMRRIQEQEERPRKQLEKSREKKKLHLYKGRAPQHVTPKDP